MRITAYLGVATTFIGTALVAYAVIRSVGGDATFFALVAGALVASQVGTWLWHRQAPNSPERTVKLGLGVFLSVTAVVFSLVFQAISGWLEYPQVTVPIAAIGSFVFPFAVVGPLWKSFSTAKKPDHDA